MRETAVREEARRVLELAKERGALTFGRFRLSSGRESSYYFDGRLLSLDPEGAYRIARALLPLLRGLGAQAVAGPTLGGDPIVSAVALLSYIQGSPMPGVIVRKEAKGHGRGRMVEGPLPEGGRVAVVDDTCTTGSSLLHAVRAVEEAGCTVVGVLCVLDRREGGRERVRELGYPFLSLLEATPEGDIRLSDL